MAYVYGQSSCNTLHSSKLKMPTILISKSLVHVADNFVFSNFCLCIAIKSIRTYIAGHYNQPTPVITPLNSRTKQHPFSSTLHQLTLCQHQIFQARQSFMGPRINSNLDQNYAELFGKYPHIDTANYLSLGFRSEITLV